MSAKEDSTTEWFASEARLEEIRDALTRSPAGEIISPSVGEAIELQAEIPDAQDRSYGVSAILVNVWNAFLTGPKAVKALDGSVAKFGRIGELCALAGARGWRMSDFKGRHFGGEIVRWAVRWYCRYPSATATSKR